jgi:ArsR family transcriptional regulator, arsenate/arsenite/antimonite-responsive transcriptional repressor
LTHVEDLGSMVIVPKPLPMLEDTSPLRCAPLSTAGMVPVDDAVAMAVRLKALADPVRIQLVSLLLARSDGRACTCDLAPAVRLSEPTVSHHLKRLLGAGLVTKRRLGGNVYYRLVPDALRAISRVLDVPESHPAATPSRAS